MYQLVNLAQKFSLFSEQWQPKVVAEMNDYQFKVVKVESEFQWHRHADTDETFIVLGGELRIEFRAGPSGDGSIVLRAGQMAVVPKWRMSMICRVVLPPEVGTTVAPSASAP